MKRSLILFCVLVVTALACGKGGVRAQFATQTAFKPQPVQSATYIPAPSEAAQAQPTQAAIRPRQTRTAQPTRTPRLRVTSTRPADRPQQTPPPAADTRRALQADLQADITYCITEANLALKLDIYTPPQARLPAPLVMYVHGGGWTSGDKRGGSGMQFAPELLQRGYVFVSINYRLGLEHSFPAQIEDVLCAVRFLRAHAAEYGIDQQRFGVIGGSAGGHLVSLLGVVGDEVPWQKLNYEERYDGLSHRVQAVVDLFGPANLTTLFPAGDNRQPWRLFGGSSMDDPVFKLYSPVTYASPEDPPFLILHGDKDMVVPLDQSQDLFDALKMAGVPVELLVVHNAGHGFNPEGGEIDPPMPLLIRRVGNFYDRLLGSK